MVYPDKRIQYGTGKVLIKENLVQHVQGVIGTAVGFQVHLVTRKRKQQVAPLQDVLRVGTACRKDIQLLVDDGYGLLTSFNKFSQLHKIPAESAPHRVVRDAC